jgi:hypothetical protein
MFWAGFFTGVGVCIVGGFVAGYFLGKMLDNDTRRL